MRAASEMALLAILVALPSRHRLRLLLPPLVAVMTVLTLGSKVLKA